jgi:arginyl-tRNA synthetase
MPTILHQLDQKFRAAIQAAFNIDSDPQLAASQNEKFGDYQSNAAMGLTKILAEKENKKLNPRAIAEQIKSKLDLPEIASEISIAGPGFINVRLNPDWLAIQLAAPLIEKVSKPQTIVVDYSGPNIAKEMHVGHLRSTIIGDAISRLLEALGNNIERQNHIGDWGTQFGMLIAQLRIVLLPKDGSSYAGLSRPSGDPFEIPKIVDLEDFYRSAKIAFDEDSTFADLARQNVVKLQSGSPEEIALWKGIVDATRQHYQAVYKTLEVLLTQEDERGESSYNDKLPQVVTDLKRLPLPSPATAGEHSLSSTASFGTTGEGHPAQDATIAQESEGAIVVKVPGYESPLIIQKSDGGYLYGTTDLAAIRFRMETFHADKIIYVHDSRQQQHFNQIFWTAEQAGWAKPGTLIYAPFGTMLGEDGKPFKTRTGGTVKLKDLLDEAEDRALAVVTEKNPDLAEEKKKAIAHAVGIGAVKYADLAKDRISDYHFSFDKMLALDGNTAPYLQYAHARIRSIGRKAKDIGATDGPIKLESPYELALAKHILRFGEIIDLCARELKPHHLCTYLYELATRFSGFYENCPVLQSDDTTRASRLSLCNHTAKALETGLDLLGIEHPDQM